MAGLPTVTGEFRVTGTPELRFSTKGNAWAKIRGRSTSRIRGANGEWADGKTLFIDIIVSGKYAENLMESVDDGDTVLVHGELDPNEWTDKDGNVRKDLQIRASEVAVSLKWKATGSAPKPKPATPIDAVREALGAIEIQQETAPF